MFARCYRVVEHVSACAALLGVVALLVAIGVTMADIVLRPFDHAVPGVVEIVQLSVMAAASLVIPHTFLANAHVAIDLLVRKLPWRVGSALRFTAMFMGTVLFVLLLRYGWDSAAQQYRFGDRSHTAGIPLYWYWTPLLAGLALSAVATLSIGCRELAGAIRGGDPIPARDR